jgi:hypothetical protein
MALLLALGALLLAGLLAAGSLAWSMRLQRSALDAVYELQAREGAEYGVAAVLANWNPAWNTGLSLGEARQIHRSSPLAGTSVTATLARGAGPLFWIFSTGRSGPGDSRRTAQRTTVALIKLDWPADLPRAALTSLGPLHVAGIVAADKDTAAEAASCADVAAVAGLALPELALLCSGACGALGNVRGDPPLSLEPVLWSERWQDSVLEPWRTFLDQRATMISDSAVLHLSGSETGRCPFGTAGVLQGAATCERQAVVVRTRGNLVVEGGSWRGAVLAGGDVELRDGARWSGIVIAMGRLSLRSGSQLSGAAVVGTAQVSQAAVAYSEIESSAGVFYSRCAVEEALAGVARPLPLSRRWLLEVF